jgi:glycogen debranching enzyme
VSDDHIEPRDVATISADQRPSQREYRQYLGIVDALRSAEWETERQPADSPFSVEDPGFTAISARAATDLASVAAAACLDGWKPGRLAESMGEGLDALWDDDLGWYRPYDTLGKCWVGPAASTGLVAICAGIPEARTRRMMERVDSWRHSMPGSIPTAQPEDPSFDPIRYWRGPVWVLVNWLVADGLLRAGFTERAAWLHTETRDLVEQGFSEYYDPRNSAGIEGQSFSWSAALTLDWLTRE